MGGPGARRGFSYQDYAAAYYFLKEEDAYELKVEKDADFTCIIRGRGERYNFHFQAKSKEKKHITWTYFKEKIAPTMTELIGDYQSLQEKGEAEVIPRFFVVMNCNTNDTLSEFLDDLKEFQRERLTWKMLKSSRGHKGKIERLRKEMEVGESEVFLFLRSLQFDKRTKGEFNSEISKILKDCHIGRWSEGKEKLLRKIRDTDEGIFSKEEIEDILGFNISRRGESSSKHNFEELSRKVDRIKEDKEEKAENYSGNITKERKIVGEYIQQLEEKSEINEHAIEAHATHVDDDFSELADVEKKKANLSHSISKGLENLKDEEENVVESDDE